MSPLSQPLGVVLQQAGLVSATQIEMALTEQRQANQLRLGEILAKHGWIQQETADFFAQRWFALPQRKKRPLGQYLKEAALLDESQIQAILAEQKQSGQRFGEIAVIKQWLAETTLTFFLKHLQSPYQTFKLQLEAKAECPYTVLEAILSWTNHHPILTEKICQFIERSQLLIATGDESIQVERLVYAHVVDRWERGIAADYLCSLGDHLLNHSQDPLTLLLVYQEIWQQGAVADGSQSQAALLEIGLVIEQQQTLEVANRIYHAVFNYKWVVLEVAKMIESRLDRSPAKIPVELAIAAPSALSTSDAPTVASLRAIAQSSPARRWPKRLLILAISAVGAGFAAGLSILPRLTSITTSPEASSASVESESAPAPETIEAVPSSEDSADIPTFTTGTTGEQLRQALGEPTRNRQGYWSNSRAWLYEEIVPEVDLGYLLDASTGRVRQTEGSFTQAVRLPDIQQALDGMLGGSTPPAVQERLAQIYLRQGDRYSFTVANLEGVIERNEQDRIYIGVWEADFH
ncbi:MAG: hypothetical protein ACFB4I_24560 [Cyanophyceae cyanobacterium]